MKFRPCIDIHNGKVKQIVGGSLSDKDNFALDNFVSDRDAGYYARLYKERGLHGGHVIILNKEGSAYYPECKRQAFGALEAFDGGLQIGGGINDKNAEDFLNAGASHVIVTSYVFSGGSFNLDNLKRLAAVTGKERLVLDLSCRKKGDDYYIVTDRWQKFTPVKVTLSTLGTLAEYCDEFLVHAVDVEGKALGIERGLAALLGSYRGLPVTYAGGIASFEDIETLRELGNGRLDFTVGSALDIFGGNLDFDKVAGKRSTS
ncbi:MAG: phosphoribosylformimino-5-aminoimidazole carboxamide ribotide isomerase [Oscillospiraceae bacterium]|nr:phosphoribosylformimino-5-aminoimidazole carboxamide ribotide isomerase [Oscillospiraceae bacterium]